MVLPVLSHEWIIKCIAFSNNAEAIPTPGDSQSLAGKFKQNLCHLSSRLAAI